MAKLTISFDSWGHWPRSQSQTIETARSCLYDMNRVEEIDLNGFSSEKLEDIFRDMPKSAPQLHTLCIDQGIDDFSFPEDFLYNTERLQRVELSYCKISWETQLLTGLTRLNLERSLKENSSIIQVLHALQRMPALTELRLIDSIPAESGGASIYPVVDLPCLRILHIVSFIGPLTTFLRHITFPHSAILNLTCGIWSSQINQIDFSNFLSVLTTKFLSSLVIRSLQVSLQHVSDGLHGLKFNLSTTAFNQACFPPPSSLFSRSQLQLSLTWPLRLRHSHGKVLTNAFDAMNLSFLTQLQLSYLSPSCIDSKTWAETFGRLPLLEWVCMRRSTPHSFVEALVYEPKADVKSKVACSVSFPKLRNIHLEGTCFGSRLEISRYRSLSVEKLLDYLMERCDRKAEIQVLRLDNCSYISSGDVERLKEIVVDVTWDGVEQEDLIDDWEWRLG